MRTRGLVYLRRATQLFVDLPDKAASSLLADLQLLRKFPNACSVSHETQHLDLLGREIWPTRHFPSHRLEPYVPTNVCGHPYNSEIRSYVSRLGVRSPDSISRYCRTLTPTNQAARHPETLTLPSALHHPRVRGQGRHVQSLERAEDGRSGHFVTRAARSLERGGPSVITGGREQRASPSQSPDA